MNGAFMLDRISSVALIAERKQLSGSESSMDLSLEQSTEGTTNAILAVLTELGLTVREFSEPSKFLDVIGTFRPDTVFAPWLGKGDPSRVALVPSMCEVANISYVGSDPFSRVSFYDKMTVLRRAAACGFRVPKTLEIMQNRPIASEKIEKYPVIVKPNFQGSSIGIDDMSVCSSFDEVLFALNRLFQNEFSQNLVQEYITGKEVNIAILGNCAGISHIKMAEIVLRDNQDYLLSLPYDHLAKRGLRGPRQLNRIDTECHTKSIEAAINLYFSQTKPHMMRIDGKLDAHGRFVMFEVATFPLVGPGSDFTKIICGTELKYTEFIKQILDTSIN